MADLPNNPPPAGGRPDRDDAHGDAGEEVVRDADLPGPHPAVEPPEDAADDRQPADDGPRAPEPTPPEPVRRSEIADLLVGGPDDAPLVHPAEQTQTLKFYFTPRSALAGEMERLQTENPHAKESTVVPNVVEALQAQFPDAVGDVTTYAGETTVYVGKGRIADVCLWLRDEVGFDYLADIATVDRFTEDDRFEVVYNVCSIKARKRLRLKVRVDEDDAVVPTVTGVWPGANWHEREAWDMMGVRFDGHPDLRRIYMPEDFEYHPLRKEFPTLGIPGSLPLPPNSPDGQNQLDPFARAHGQIPKDLSTD